MKRLWLSLLAVGFAVPCWGQVYGQVALRQSDAVEILIGPIFDATDLASGTWTPETALTIEDEHVLLTKCTAAADCAAQAAKAETTNCSHVGVGVYECDLNTADTGTVGILRVDVQMSGTTPVWATFAVVETGVFDGALADGATHLLDTDMTGHQTQGTLGQAIGDPAADTDTIFAKVNNLPADPADDSDIDAQLATIVADTNEVQVTLAAGGTIESLVDDLPAILADTNEVQVTLAAGGTIESLVDDIETRLGTPSDLGGGASVAGNLADIEGQTDDIGVAGIGLTAIPEGFIEQFACDSGDTDNCVDAGLDEADGFWRGTALRQMSTGLQRCIAASDQSDTNVTVVPPFPGSLGTGTVQIVRDAICAGVDPTYTP